MNKPSKPIDEPPPATPAAPEEKKRIRLRPEQREQLIVSGAIRYFSDHGFSGDTRTLAQELGVTQSLLFRYFPSKDLLIERVYREIFVGRWNPMWEQMIIDRTKPLKERLLEFFSDYARTTLDRDWIRVFFFAGLKGADMNKHFLANVRERVLLPICREMRHEFDLPPPQELPISEFEVELAFGIIGRMVYFGVRKWIYQTPVPDSLDEHIRATVEVFFDGVQKPLSHHLITRTRKALVRRSRTQPD